MSLFLCCCCLFPFYFYLILLLFYYFFYSRLKTNVRLVLSLPDLELASNCGLLGMKNLLSVIEVCYELAWDRKKLLHVANYHLKSKRMSALRENILNVEIYTGTPYKYKSTLFY